jgi:hypothetical protein
MRRLCHILLVVVPAASLLACSSGPKAYIPVDNVLRTWQPPESDAYTPDPAPAPAATSAPAPSPGPAKKK